MSDDSAPRSDDRFSWALIVAALASVVGHVVVARALDALPARERSPIARRIEIRVVEPPRHTPEPEPPPQPPPVPTPEPPPEVAPRPRPRQPPRQPAPAEPTPTETPAEPALNPNATTSAAGSGPVFGVTMESTSQGGTTNVPVGNTAAATPPATAPAGGAPAAAAAHEVTKMPLPQGRCSGAYTAAARTAGIEGVVVLDLVVDETGKPRDIKVVEGLEHGLTEAAVAAVRACRFTPGEREGAPVAVRVRGFKIRFVLGDES